ncbi:unnamed protein product [Rhizoctonia solani]|uniref:Small ribosomal subunit protein uS10 domain-containing protein n=1 Tax=Rhizoctonia solani TaxID=456999 RepID=A0A8H3ABA6_9AGAM|nr:unnamed protein product [Rhizoctonia solani]
MLARIVSIRPPVTRASSNHPLQVHPNPHPPQNYPPKSPHTTHSYPQNPSSKHPSTHEHTTTQSPCSTSDHTTTPTSTHSSTSPTTQPTHSASPSPTPLPYPPNAPSSPTPLPTQRSLFTVPKSPFIFKKAQENFEKRTHKRAVKVWDAEDEVVNIWLRYLEEHMVPGVGMRVVRWERCAVGVGEARWKEVGERVVGVGEQVRQIGERIVREEADAARKAAEVKAE